MKVYRKWVDLLAARGESRVSEKEFRVRKDELVRVAEDDDLEGMAILIGVAEGAVACRLRPEYEKVLESLRSRREELQGIALQQAIAV